MNIPISSGDDSSIEFYEQQNGLHLKDRVGYLMYIWLLLSW